MIAKGDEKSNTKSPWQGDTNPPTRGFVGSAGEGIPKWIVRRVKKPRPEVGAFIVSDFLKTFSGRGRPEGTEGRDFYTIFGTLLRILKGLDLPGVFTLQQFRQHVLIEKMT